MTDQEQEQEQPAFVTVGIKVPNDIIPNAAFIATLGQLVTMFSSNGALTEGQLKAALIYYAETLGE